MPEPLAPPRLRGHLDIRPRVVDRLAARAAAEVEGVVPGRTGRITRHDLPSATSEVNGSRVRLDVDVAVAWGCSLVTVVAQVQQHVVDRVELVTGMRPDAVDVSVESVVVPGRPAARRVQ